MLQRIAVLLVVLTLGLAGAGCGGDDGDAATDNSAAAVTQAPDEGDVGSGEPTGDCDIIQVLLKLDVADDQQEDVAEILDGIEGVSHELAEAASDAEPSMFLVKAETDEAADAVGSELSGHPAVVSVVFPEQLC